MTATSPEELEALLEDAVLLADEAALVDLCGPWAVVVSGTRVIADVTLLARLGYVAGSASATLLQHDLALVAGERSVTVSARGSDGAWRLLVTVLR